MGIATIGRSRPKHGVVVADTSASFVPVLSDLAKAKTATDARRILDAVPRFLWPGLVKTALQRTYIIGEVRAVLIASISQRQLKRELGPKVAQHLREQYGIQRNSDFREQAERLFAAKAST